MRKSVFIGVSILIIVVLGIFFGLYLYNMNNIKDEEMYNSITEVDSKNNNIESTNTIEIVNQEEKTTPNTLMIYKTYYTECNHYINEYISIDISAVNLTKDEIKERNRDWNIVDFSPEQIVFEREEEGFCNEHFKLKLIDNKIIIFSLDKDGNETEYQRTEITSEYLTNEDILKLKEGILVYGIENLTSTLEDYE